MPKYWTVAAASLGYFKSRDSLPAKKRDSQNILAHYMALW